MKTKWWGVVKIPLEIPQNGVVYTYEEHTKHFGDSDCLVLCNVGEDQDVGVASKALKVAEKKQRSLHKNYGDEFHYIVIEVEV